MRIGDKFFDNNNIITIYNIYRNTVKVKFNNETRYRYIKKKVLNSYRYLIPIGYVESFYVYDPKKIDFPDLIFIFFPNNDSTIWDHSFNSNPSIIKNRLSDNILNEGFSIYDITMTNIDMSDDWLFYSELDDLSKMDLKYKKYVSIYVDTSIDDYLNLLQDTLLEYNKIVEQSSDIIIKNYNEDYKRRTTAKEVLDFMSLFRGIDFSLDILEGKYTYTLIDKTKPYGLIGIEDIDVEDFICRCGDSIKDLIVIRYWYDIDLNSILMNHYLIRDPITGNLYIFIYNTNGISQEALDKVFNKYEQSVLLSRMEA